MVSVPIDHCPSCGAKLEGERRSVKYQGRLTVVRVIVVDENGEEHVQEHVCGD